MQYKINGQLKEFDFRESITLSTFYHFQNFQNTVSENNISQNTSRSFFDTELRKHYLFIIKNVGIKIINEGENFLSVYPFQSGFERIKEKILADGLIFLSYISDKKQLKDNLLNDNVLNNVNSGGGAPVYSDNFNTNSIIEQKEFIIPTHKFLFRRNQRLTAPIGQHVVSNYTIPVPQMSVSSYTSISQKIPMADIVPSLFTPWYVPGKRGFITACFTTFNSEFNNFILPNGFYDTGSLPGKGYSSFIDFNNNPVVDIDIMIKIMIDIERFEAYE